jgi:hypothetical protein
MKYAAVTTIALAALLQAANANFDLYRVGIGGDGISGNAEGWHVYEGEPSCDQALDWIWRDSEDVSGGKYGVRCEGDGCPRSDVDLSLIEVVEMNFNREEHHWSKILFAVNQSRVCIGLTLIGSLL